MKKIKIASNYEILSATIFEANQSDKVLIIASATGIKQKFYKKFSFFLAKNGITVITFDYYGIGRSLIKPIKELKNNAADWGRNDLESIIQYAISNYPNAKKIVLGHSIGGQLIGLSKSSIELDKIILVAAQSGYWKYWKGIGKLKMWFNWHILFPVLLNTFGYLNSKKISGMENLPKNVAIQWSNWGKNQNYLLSDTSINQMYYDKINSNLIAFSIEDDSFAPLSAVEWMTDQYKNTKKKSIHLKPSDFGAKKIGHFGIFKQQFENSIWSVILNEIMSSYPKS